MLLWGSHMHTQLLSLYVLEQRCQSAIRTSQLHSTHTPATWTLLMLPMLSPALGTGQTSGWCWRSGVSSGSVSNVLQKVNCNYRYELFICWHCVLRANRKCGKMQTYGNQPKDIFHSPFWYSCNILVKCNFSLSLFNHCYVTLWLSEETTCKYQYNVCESKNIAVHCRQVKVSLPHTFK